MEEINEVEFLKKKYNLIEHPEGGYFKEIYKSHTFFQDKNLYNDQKRSVSTFIYFLLAGENRSYWHRLKSDEIWHFYSGSTLVIHTFDEMTQELKEFYLGNKLKDENSEFIVVIPKNLWFGAKLLDKKCYAFVGCSMAPGFEYEDFELAKKNELEKKHPKLEGILNF